MNNKNVLIITVIAIVVGIIVCFVLAYAENNSTDRILDNMEIPDDYIAVFHGGVGEMTNENKIYSIKEFMERFLMD